ncbi:hypothetical protein M422DRAFT_778632 [Sphaerobolus stellatus SS14]|uniref:WSC domain-containing protein n=1 Tax=Sphaerobolus stellatus (strain SS14) TaxID=990650 RepID=A0A0C9VFT8_SPHS4|nr:hypothetical protein M422DRAFT_778632 [Sphaerobolus stellatus SS14]
MSIAIKAPVLFSVLSSMLSVYATAIEASVRARQASLPSGWSALGCFSDSPTARALRTSAFTSVDSMTITSCINFCTSGGFDFAGVEFGRECYCDTIIHGPSGLVSNSSDCNVACSGDPTTICGGAQRINVFSTPAPPPTPTQTPNPVPTVDFLAGPNNALYELEGCFVDPRNPRGLLHRVNLPGLTTPSACALACNASGFQVMGLENGVECWCDNYMPYSVQASTSGCNLPCNGDLTKSCGGVRNLQLYGRTIGAPLEFQSSAICMDQGPLGLGRDSANYFAFSFRGLTSQGDILDVIAQQLNPGATTDQQFILTTGDCTSSPCPASFKFFQLIHNQIVPYGILGNPVTLRAAVGESQFFTAFSSDTPFTGYCAGALGTNNLPFFGFPALSQTDGSSNQWGLCHNTTANGRLDALYIGPNDVVDPQFFLL